MNVFVFGLGPHTKRIYFNFLKNDKRVKKLFIVDLQSEQEKIKEFLNLHNVNYELILFDQKDRNKERFTKKHQQYLSKIKRMNCITKAIIGTEPRGHKQCINFCLENGIDILCDKPLTAPLYSNTQLGASKILEDYYELLGKYKNSSSQLFEVQTQRRFHDGYNFIYEEIKSIVEEYRVPITKIKINHCDGMWNMPNEIIYKENHPYKYGYGKLMHSGYHFLDLLSYFYTINSLNGFDYSEQNIHLSDYRPSDLFTYFGEEFYKKIGFEEKIELFENKEIFRNFGELDLNSIIEFKDNNGNIITTAMLDLSQSGFSRRSWFELPKDTYKGNGRVRHELFEITVGPLMNIKVLSFQSNEIKKEKGMENKMGYKDHFEILIFRNSDLIGGKPFEVKRISANNGDSEYLGNNERARYNLINKFLEGEKTISNIEYHESSIKLLSEFYSIMAKRFDYNFRFSVEAIIEHNGKFLICKRNEDLEVAPGIWNVPAGKVKYYEGIEEALVREVYEETGLTVDKPTYCGYKIINKTNKRVVYTYYCSVDNISSLNIDECEFSEFEWIHPNDVVHFESLDSKIKEYIQEQPWSENTKKELVYS
ncbi:NUDIX domain-containing protein [Bacillus paramycoides]|uniref:NUDIX domain-containing protein n=1 Tax=Bacillus paramycoides TaxID=2026194 RepID=UPI003D00AF47